MHVLRLRPVAAFPLALSLALASSLGACAGANAPPAELAGLWSSGQAACDAQIGVEFNAKAVESTFQGDRQVLFAHPRYETEAAEHGFQVRIEYDLPRFAGGATASGAYGVIELERGEDGRLRPLSHTLIDPRTGSARTRIASDPVMSALDLVPCSGQSWGHALRGRSSA